MDDLTLTAPTAPSRVGDPWNLSASLPLEPSELERMIMLYKTNQDVDACNTVIQSHLRLVAKLASSVASPTVSRDDLMSEGALALRKCLDNFDTSRGSSFTAYASVVVHHTLRSVARSQREMLNVPNRDRAQLGARMRWSSQFYQRTGRQPGSTDHETSSHSTRPASSSSLAGTTASGWCVSIEQDAEPGCTKSRMLADACPSPLDQVATRDEQNQVKACLASLPHQIASALRLRFGLNKAAQPLSIPEIARQLKVPRSVAEGLVSDGIRRLRVSLSATIQRPGHARPSRADADICLART